MECAKDVPNPEYGTIPGDHISFITGEESCVSIVDPFEEDDTSAAALLHMLAKVEPSEAMGVKEMVEVLFDLVHKRILGCSCVSRAC